MDDRETWQEYIDFREISRLWSKIAFRRSRLCPESQWREQKRAQTTVSNLRSRMRPPFSLGGDTEVKRWKRNITSEARRVFGQTRNRTNFTVIIGKNKRGDKTGRSRVTITIGWLWARDVYTPLYERGFFNDDWLILGADELKVNAKHIRLFECVGYNQRLDQTKTVYIGEKTTGEVKFILAHTVQSAIKGVEDMLAREVHITLIGEDNETSNG